MNYSGSDLKFRITTSIDGFSLSDNDFSVAVKNRLGKTIYSVSKSDCFTDDNGDWYFTISNVPNGYLFAYFKGEAEDADFESEVRCYTDEQLLCSVGVCDCSNSSTSSCTCTHNVEYTQIYTSNASGVQYLCDEDGNYILDSDGNRIELSASETSTSTSAKVKLNMTGEEFKQFIEGTNPDGIVDTVQETLNLLKGISDDENLEEHIKTVAEEVSQPQYDEENKKLTF